MTRTGTGALHHPQDGVTHFRLRFTRAAPPAAWQVAALCHWRERLHAIGLVGQMPERYGGVGFGNLSARHPHRRDAFIVTGTQTGERRSLGPHDFAIVTQVDTAQNRVRAHGGCAPSSEAMTHAVCYAADARVRFVFHGHSPMLWRSAQRLQVASTPEDVGYGTPEMANAVAALLRARERHDPSAEDLEPLLIRMAGHEDGIIAVGGTADATGNAIIAALERLANESNPQRPIQR